ncbi:MAG: class I SAM-dependent methyltransferase [Nitrospirota bacterium]|nr:class I SAM-dependent methyltransferase [Nitrospirota bacterium]
MPSKFDACPYCNSLQYEVVLEVLNPELDTYSTLIGVTFPPPVCYYECSSCGLTYRNQTFTAVEASALYQSAYRNHILKKNTADEYFNKVIGIPAAESELDAKISHLNSLIRGKSVRTAVDIGCGVGAFMYKLHASNPGISVFGIEPTTDFAIVASSRNDTEVLNKPYDGFDLSGYDLVSCIHVLEHTEQPWTFISALNRNMRPNAYLYIETPSTEDIVALPADHDRFMSPHNYLFSKKFMQARFAETDFAILDIGYAGTHRGKVDLRIFAVRK